MMVDTLLRLLRQLHGHLQKFTLQKLTLGGKHLRNRAGPKRPVVLDVVVDSPALPS